MVWQADLHPKHQLRDDPKCPMHSARALLKLQIQHTIYKDRFFYQIYFHDLRVAEVQLESDIRTELTKVFYSASGDPPQHKWVEPQSQRCNIARLAKTCGY